MNMESMKVFMHLQ